MKNDAEKRSAEEWIAIVSRYMRFCFRTGSVPRVDELATMLSMSREEFTRAFRGSTGRSPASTFRRMQLRSAMNLLAGSDRATADIARATAYGSTRAFYRAFLRGTGMTPTQYRSRARRRNQGDNVPNTTKETG
jgi:AraC-like DNA-binding protein